MNYKQIRVLDKLEMPMMNGQRLELIAEREGFSRRSNYYHWKVWLTFYEDYKKALAENNEAYFDCERRIYSNQWRDEALKEHIDPDHIPF